MTAGGTFGLRHQQRVVCPRAPSLPRPVLPLPLVGRQAVVGAGMGVSPAPLAYCLETRPPPGVVTHSTRVR